MITYETQRAVTPDQFVGVLNRSTLAGRRPVEDRDCVEKMVRNADLTITAWDGDLLVGVARSVTDHVFCCYLADLAVDRAYQRRGIGRELIRLTRETLGPRCKVVLLSAPGAVDYYPHIGFRRHESAWTIEAHGPMESPPSAGPPDAAARK